MVGPCMNARLESATSTAEKVEDAKGVERRGRTREVTAVRKLLFKIGIPLRLVGTRNADRAEATKTMSGRDEVADGTEEMRVAEKGDVRYCFIIKGSSLLARESS